MNLSAPYTPFRLPAEFWQHNRRFVALLILNGMARALTVTAVFYSIRHAVNGLQQAETPITGTLWMMVFLAAVLLGARMHEHYTAERMSQNYINRLRRRLLSRLMRASARDVNSIPSGALAARLGGDLSSLRRWLSLGLSRLIVNTILLLASIGIITGISVTAGLISALVVTLLTLVSLRLGENLRTVLRVLRSTHIRIQSLLVERVGEMAMIRVMGQEGREIRRINRLGKKLERKASAQGLMLGSLRGLGEAGGILLIITAFAVFRLPAESIAAADAAAVISLVMFMSGPIRELGRVQEYYRGAAISLNKLSELFNMHRITRGASRYIEQLTDPGAIEFRKVDCAPAIRNFSGKVAAGERVAVIGRNGSGKSTLMQLAVGLLKPDSGVVKLGGVDPRRLSPDTRAKSIGVSGAGFGLLKGELGFNMAYRRPEASDDELQRAAAEFELGPLIEKMDHDTKNQIQQGAKNISAGERARIGLVRATLGTPAILILDEPESNLDSEGLEKLHEVLETWPGTVLLITHQQSLIDLCQQVWNMNTGEVYIRKGTVSILAAVQNG